MTDPVNITIMSCVYGRPRVTKTFIDGLIRLKKHAPSWVHLKFLLVYSNIADLLTIKHAIHDFDNYFHLVYAPNYPLGRKHNMGLSYLCNCGVFDYCMQLGSDDLLSDEVWNAYRPWFKEERKFFGVTSVYLYDGPSGRIKICQGNQVFGAGRCIHSSVVRQFVRTTEYAQFWTDSAQGGLDIDSERNISKEIGFSALRVTPIRTNKPIVMDIKTADNINSYVSMPGEPVPVREHWQVTKRFPEIIDYGVTQRAKQNELSEKIS